MKIRKLGWIVVGFILLAIIAFLLQAAFDSNSSLLRPGSNNAGEVNGKSIDIQDYQAKVDRQLEIARNQGQVDVSEQVTWTIRDQVWNKFVTDILMGERYEKAGIRITEKEMSDFFRGSNPHPAVLQSFSNPQTGAFDPQELSNFLRRLEEENNPGRRAQWEGFKEYLKDERLASKYAALVKKSMYASSWQAAENHNFTAASVDFEYVFLPYADIPDTEVPVTDSELSKYINTRKSLYKQEESRSIEYVSFDILPTAQDTQRAKTKLTGLYENFKNTKSDSSFLKLYSDDLFDTRYLSRDLLMTSMKDSLFAVDTGTILGPYLENGFWKYAKLVDKKLIPDSVKARHIFLSIATARSQEDVQFKRNQADSLLTLLNGGADFTLLCLQFSDDDATKFTGGDWGWIKPDQKYFPINDALFYKKTKGEYFLIPADEPGNAGFHIIQITDANPTTLAAKVAFLTGQITASTETERARYADASKFASSNNTAAQFRAAGNEYVIKKAENLKKNDFAIQGQSAREVVSWAFSANVNDVSQVFSLQDKYIVVLLTGAKKEGIASVNDMRTEVEMAVRKEKKAQLWKDKTKGQTDLNAIASAYGKQVQQAEAMSASVYFLTGAGMEPAVVGKALAMNQGETSGAIVGENGVFFVRVVSKNNPAPPSDLTFLKKQLTQTPASMVDMSLPEAIRKSADIKDERYKFYTQ